jgi:hypothetical protein
MKEKHVLDKYAVENIPIPLHIVMSANTPHVCTTPVHSM